MSRTRRRALGVLLALGWVGLPAQAGGGDGARTGVGPHLSVAPTAFDFGRAQPNQVLRQSFRLTNLGDLELRIEDVSTDCGCTAALRETRDHTLAPGASATLDVSLETGTAPGPVVRHVRIVSSDPQHKVVELKLTVEVQPEPQRAGDR